MDWRAKSQSRSRSRLPDKAMMDWRAQSRSRSRAPDFRLAGVALPPVASYDMATAQLNLNAPSRFYGDHGIIPASLDNDNIHYDLAQSLGLSGDAFGSYGVDGVDLPELVSPVEQVEGSLHNVSLPVPGAQAAADLDWSSVPSSYDLGIHSYPITKEPISKSPVVASQAQQQLQQLMQPVSPRVLLLTPHPHCLLTLRISIAFSSASQAIRAPALAYSCCWGAQWTCSPPLGAESGSPHDNDANTVRLALLHISCTYCSPSLDYGSLLLWWHGRQPHGTAALL